MGIGSNRRSHNSDTHLAKQLTAIDFFTIGFGSIIGVGWVMVIGEWFNLGGGAYTTAIAFIIGALILLPIANIYAKLTIEMPSAGGAVNFVIAAFGKTAGFITGWFLSLGYILLCPWEAIALGQIFEVLLPIMKVIPLYSVMGQTIYFPTLLAVLFTTGLIAYINIRGISFVAKFQKVLTIGLILVSFVAIVTSLLLGDYQNALPLIAKTEKNPSGSILLGILSVLAITPFFYSGFDTIPQEAEEHNENTNLISVGKTITYSIISAAVFYLFIIIAVATALPWQQSLLLSMPSAEVFEIGLGVPIMAKVILIGAILGLITTLNSFFAAGARVLLSMGRHGLLGDVFGLVHPLYKTPKTANLFISIITITGILIGRKLLLPLINICSFSFILTWFSVCLSSIALTRRKSIQIRGSLIMPIVSVFLSVAMLLLLILPNSPGALIWPLEWGLVMFWGVTGLVLNMNRRKRSLLNKSIG